LSDFTQNNSTSYNIGYIKGIVEERQDKDMVFFSYSVVWWPEFLDVNPEVPGSIPGATRFSEYQWVWNGVHLAFVRINEELLERKVGLRSRKLRLTTVGDPPR
jgi:hypothetical protein